RLFHEGQFEGRTVRLPVFLGRRPEETVNQELQTFYARLLSAINATAFREGQWQLCERTGWPDNASFMYVVAWAWSHQDDRYLIVVNLSGSSVQARVQVPWPEMEGKILHLVDLISGVSYQRDA